MRRIKAGLTMLGSDHYPRAGWDANVLAYVARRVRRQTEIAIVVCAVVVVALISYAWWLTAKSHEDPLKLELQIEHGRP